MMHKEGISSLKFKIRTGTIVYGLILTVHPTTPNYPAWPNVLTLHYLDFARNTLPYFQTKYYQPTTVESIT